MAVCEAPPLDALGTILNSSAMAHTSVKRPQPHMHLFCSLSLSTPPLDSHTLDTDCSYIGVTPLISSEQAAPATQCVKETHVVADKKGTIAQKWIRTGVVLWGHPRIHNKPTCQPKTGEREGEREREREGGKDCFVSSGKVMPSTPLLLVGPLCKE